MYSACVKPILTYLTSTIIATTQSNLEKLNTLHRKHLRYLMRIHYPLTISNETLYRVTKQRSITLDITHSRWKLFGHILRQDPDTITNVVMRNYFDNPKPKIHYNMPSSLPKQLHRDLALIKQGLTLKKFSKFSPRQKHMG